MNCGSSLVQVFPIKLCYGELYLNEFGMWCKKLFITQCVNTQAKNINEVKNYIKDIVIAKILLWTFEVREEGEISSYK